MDKREESFIIDDIIIGNPDELKLNDKSSKDDKNSIEETTE